MCVCVGGTGPEIDHWVCLELEGRGGSMASFGGAWPVWGEPEQNRCLNGVEGTEARGCASCGSGTRGASLESPAGPGMAPAVLVLETLKSRGQGVGLYVC